MNKTKLVFLVFVVMVTIPLFAQDYCLDFDGANDYVQTTYGGEVKTLEFWLNTDDLSEDHSFFGQRYDANEVSGNWLMDFKDPGNLRIYGYDPNGTDMRTNATFETERWYHIAVTSDGSAVTFYIDGVYDNVHSFDAVLSGGSNIEELSIGGAFNNEVLEVFNGKLDEVRVWSDVRTETEIQNNMYNELAGNEANLVAYYNFNEGSGSNLNDLTSNNNDGTLHNFALTGQSSNWVLSDSPLPATLSNFSAFYNNEILTINWATESEENNIGWNIYRGIAEDALQNGAVIQINNQLIPGAGTTNISTEYSYIDEQPIQAGETYWYWLEDVSSDGETEIHPPTSLSIPMGDPPDVPIEYGLHQNYPNPFNPSTTISFTLNTENTEKVEIEIFNLKGQKIRTYPVILNEDDESTNYYSIIWNGKDEHGKAVSSGVYYYKLKTTSQEYSRKMILIK